MRRQKVAQFASQLEQICLEDNSSFESQGIGEGLKPKELEEDDVAASYSFVGRARELLLVPFVDILVSTT
ncbi:hypothetical protein Leryth_025029 [Lithospermum erythrorhizon]|nr:hypothetical protein Leryth_025029 [Lithospermum erythrorhizon]